MRWVCANPFGHIEQASTWRLPPVVVGRSAVDDPHSGKQDALSSKHRVTKRSTAGRDRTRRSRTYIFLYTYIFLCIHVYIYIHTYTDRHPSLHTSLNRSIYIYLCNMCTHILHGCNYLCACGLKDRCLELRALPCPTPFASKERDSTAYEMRQLQRAEDRR